jgi:outer membrane protein
MKEKLNYHRRLPHSIPIVLFCSALLLVSAVAASCAEKLSVADSVKIAIENNPTVKIAKENLNKADAQERQAIAQGMPKVTLIGTYTRLDQVTTVSFGPEPFTIGSLETRSANLAVDQPIDAFGLVRTVKGIAKLNMCSTGFGLDQAINDVTLDTKVAFFNIFRAEQFLKVQEDTVSQLKAHLKDTEARRQAGDATKFEVLRAETAVANALQGLITSQNGVQLADSSFNTVLVRPIDAPVELAEPSPPQYFTLGLDRIIATAVKSRPELRQAGYLVDIDQGLAKVARLQGKPTIGFRWNYNSSLDVSALNPRPSSWNALLSATIKLYDGGATKANTDLADSEANNARSTLERLQDVVSLEAKQSYLSVKEDQERIVAAEKGLEMAKESARLADVRYKGGVSTQVEVLDAQNALTLASTNYVNAMFDYQVAVARLERAVGGRGVLADLIAESAKGSPATPASGGK